MGIFARSGTFNTTRQLRPQQEKAMTDFAISTFETAVIAGNERRPSFGQRLLLWIETHQQRRADREIAQILRRFRN